MARHRAAVILVVATCLFVSACGGAAPTTGTSQPSSTSAPSVAEKLATIEKGAPVTADNPLVAKFRRALDALITKCKDRRLRLADMTVTSQRLLHKAGIEESLSSIIGHVNRSIPKGIGKQPCASIFAAYVTLRENG
jgi:hypothetical protein